MSKKRTKKTDEYRLQHNTFFEETFMMPEFGAVFLKKTLPRKLKKRLDIDKLTVEKTKFRETRPDVVYKVPIIGAEGHISFHVIIEHKSSDDHSAIYQIWQYVGQLCIQDVNKRLTDPETKKLAAWPKDFRLSPIIPIILHHGDKPFTGETQLVNLFYPLPGAEEYLPHLQAILVDLSAMEEGKLPRDRNAPELFVVLLMMKVIFSKDKKTLKNRFNEIFDELQPYSQIPKYRELIRKLWYYVMYNAENMTEADFTEIENKVRKAIGDDNMPTMAQIFINKGKVESKVESILATLEVRFGEIPQTTHVAVAQISDLVVLRQLTVLAAKCKTLNEFAKAVK
jgi:Putative transposase, YhgA-like.